jgi:hypothetical protein
MNPQAEVNYQTYVKPKMFDLLTQMAKDLSPYVSKDDFIRTMWDFTHHIFNIEYKTMPLWLLQELENQRREAEASMTVEGEVAGDG